MVVILTGQTAADFELSFWVHYVIPVFEIVAENSSSESNAFYNIHVVFVSISYFAKEWKT